MKSKSSNSPFHEVGLFLGRVYILAEVSSGCLATAQSQEIVTHPCKMTNLHFYTSAFKDIKQKANNVLISELQRGW